MNGIDKVCRVLIKIFAGPAPDEFIGRADIQGSVGFQVIDPVNTGYILYQVLKLFP